MEIIGRQNINSLHTVNWCNLVTLSFGGGEISWGLSYSYPELQIEANKKSDL